MNTILPLSYSLQEPNQFQLFSFFALARFFFICKYIDFSRLVAQRLIAKKKKTQCQAVHFPEDGEATKKNKEKKKNGIFLPNSVKVKTELLTR